MTMSSGSDETTKPNSGVDSSSVDDAIDGNVGGNGPLKKGPWTSTEDAILVEYVTKHGEGNWNAVQKFSGLARCGKSCRLRWANHLRPDLKKGAFMPEEERLIIELHAKMGNKWARMAAELPGRTDNEIKNYWNTRIKRKQRAGLPIYPPDISFQPLPENLQSDNMNNMSSGNVHHPDLMPINNFQIPAVEFKSLELNQLNQNIYSPDLPELPAGNLLDIPVSSLARGLNSPYHNKSLLPAVHSSKRFRGSEPFFQTFNTPVSNAFPGGNQYQSDGSMQIGKSSIYSAYPNPATEHARSPGLTIGSHAVTNGNPSSEPDWAMKLELPSLQTQMGSWGSPSPSSPLPFFESVDILTQSPPNEHMQSSNLSTQNSGLLDAVLYESETMKNSKSSGVQQTPHFSSVAVNTMDDSAHVLHETEWGAYEEQLSPLGNSSSSVFSESTPVSGNSLDEPFSSRTVQVKEEAIHGGLVPYGNEVEPRNQIFFSRPDFLLDSSCFGPVKHPTEEYSLLKASIGTLHGDDLNRVCKKVDPGASPSAQDRDRNRDPDPGAWSAMP